MKRAAMTTMTTMLLGLTAVPAIAHDLQLPYGQDHGDIRLEHWLIFVIPIAMLVVSMIRDARNSG